MNLYQVLQAPLVTEKAEWLKSSAQNGSLRYTFQVHPNANKELIRMALRFLYQVDAMKINILRMHGKLKRFRNNKFRQPGIKKAIVTLVKGQSLDLMSKE